MGSSYMDLSSWAGLAAWQELPLPELILCTESLLWSCISVPRSHRSCHQSTWQGLMEQEEELEFFPLNRNIILNCK